MAGGREMSGILFFIFASFEPLSTLLFVFVLFCVFSFFLFFFLFVFVFCFNFLSCINVCINSDRTSNTLEVLKMDMPILTRIFSTFN